MPPRFHLRHRGPRSPRSSCNARILLGMQRYSRTAFDTIPEGLACVDETTSPVLLVWQFLQYCGESSGGGFAPATTISIRRSRLSCGRRHTECTPSACRPLPQPVRIFALKLPILTLPLGTPIGIVNDAIMSLDNLRTPNPHVPAVRLPRDQRQPLCIPLSHGLRFRRTPSE